MRSVLLLQSTLVLSVTKGKPTERWGRKATGLRDIPMIAELQQITDLVLLAFGSFPRPLSNPVQTLASRHRNGGSRGF